MAASLSKAEILAELGRMGELPPKDWSKLECQMRMEELRVAQGLHPNPKARHVTPLRRLMIQLNQASTKKERFLQFWRELGVSHTASDTIPVLQRRAALAIYDKAASTAEDPVGFGKHAARTYGEMLEHEKGYVAWVIQTYEEGECDPRLARLARWLQEVGNRKNENDAQMVKTEPGASSHSYTVEEMINEGYTMKSSLQQRGVASKNSASSKSVSSSQLEQANQQIQQLMATVGQLQNEMKQMKTENEPRRKKVPSEASTMGSFEQVP